MTESSEPSVAAGKRGRREDFIAKFEELILSGRFGPGDKLPPERELALSLGASRPVVHAALGCLAARGLVRIEPRQGVFVADWRREGSVEMLLSIMSYSGGDLSPRLFDSFLEARVFFETELARLAASRRGAPQLDELERILAKERLLEYREPRSVTELDYAFHLGVALASGNDVYPLLMNSLKEIYERILDRFYTDQSVIPEVFALHRELVAAIASRDEAGSSAIMRRILEYGERNLRRIIVGSSSKRRTK